MRYVDILAAENAAELISGYASECSIPEIGNVDPQGGIYEALEKAGLMQCFAAYVKDSMRMIGFASVLVSVLPHYGQKIATMESLYVAPEHRSGGIGTELLAQIETYAQQSDCKAILYTAPTGSRLETLLSLRGSCVRTNAVFCRRLA